MCQRHQVHPFVRKLARHVVVHRDSSSYSAHRAETQRPDRLCSLPRLLLPPVVFDHDLAVPMISMYSPLPDRLTTSTSAPLLTSHAVRHLLVTSACPMRPRQM